MKFKFWISAWLVLAIHCASAQTPTAGFRNLSIKDGLVGDHILCIYQDSKGFIWIGTFAGLHRYDGYSFKVFNRDLPPDNIQNLIANNTVYSIIEDRNNKFWIGTENGLSRYDPEIDSFTNYYANPANPIKGPSNDHIRCIHEDKQGWIWIGTYGGGINSFDPEKKIFKHFKDSIDAGYLPSSRINDFYIDKNEKFWIGTEGKGLVTYEPKTGVFNYLKTDETKRTIYSRNIVNKIIEDKYGKIWIGYWGDGLCAYNPAEDKFIYYDYDPNEKGTLKSMTVRSLLEDSKGRLWLATFGGGVSLFDQKTGQFSTYMANNNDPTSLSNNILWSIFEDRSGLLWIGTHGSGIDILTPKKESFTHFETNNVKKGQSGDQISEIYEMKNGDIWIGTLDGGISILERDKNAIKRFERLQENPFTTMRSIYQDESEIIWIGTDRGLYQYNPESNDLKHYQHDPTNPSSINESGVYSIVADHERNIWVSTWESGLNRLTPEEYIKKDTEKAVFKHFNHSANDSTSLTSNKIWAIYIDNNGDLWCGTERSLDKLNSKDDTFSHFGNMNAGRIVEDEAGMFWIGTYGQGIVNFNPKTNKVKYYNNLENLDINLVLDLSQDNEGNLWIASIDGMTRFNMRTEKFVNIDLSNELKKNEYEINVLKKLKSGEMILGGDYGIDIFNPEKIKLKDNIPIVELTDFQIFNESIPVGDWKGKTILNKTLPYTSEINLSSDESLISIEFAALHFSSQEKHLYAFKLDGFDVDWKYTRSDKRKATYMNLEPGQYKFRVKAATREGNWSNERELIVNIIPPFWKTNVFKVPVGIALFLGFLFLMRAVIQSERIRAKRKYFREKLMKEQEVVLFKNQKLDAELEDKKKELANYTLNNMQKHEELTHIKEELKMVLNEIKGHPLQRRIEKLIHSVDQNLEDSGNYEHFESNLMQDDFLKRFMEAHPKLTYKDLKICTFIRMNFDNKEIARMLNITPESLGVSRTRIRKKMDLDKNVYLNDMILRF